jgi:hypothetical protein
MLCEGLDRGDISLLGDRQVAVRDQTVIGTSDLQLRSAPKVPPTEYNYFAKCHTSITPGHAGRNCIPLTAKGFWFISSSFESRYELRSTFTEREFWLGG